MATRYALYFAPERDTKLAAFGQHVLGRDAENDIAVAQFVPDGFSDEDWRTFTQSPRRYGFHATLKPPFALADGKTEEELFAAVRALARSFEPVDVSPLVVRASGSHVLLGLSHEHKEVHALADACVRDLDAFRAPPSAEQTARRLKANLSTREREHLEAWGYPYVFDTFVFHMTLAGPLPEAARKSAYEGLKALYQKEAYEPFAMGSLCIFVEAEPGASFHCALRVPLGR